MLKYLSVFLLTFIEALTMLAGCGHYPYGDLGGVGDAGGYEEVVLDLPFAEGYQTLCTQGAHGSYSHDGTSTEYDLDFDTPNGVNDIVFAPIGGTAHVHTESATKNFGYHVNIDRGDGTYVVVGHLSDIFVEDESEVAAGQIIGYEGCTGACSGDHIHVGLHEGEAAELAEFGASVPTSYFVDDVTSGEEGQTLASEDVICGGESGHVYASKLGVGTWHPNGSLVKTPDDNNVYLLEEGTRRWIETEEVFLDLGFDFRDVVLVTPDELDCYDVGATIVSANDPPERKTSSDGSVTLTEGNLVKEASKSDVYVISDGVAMPIESWEVFLKLGFGTRPILTVDDGLVRAIQGAVGSCTAGYYCIDAASLETCTTEGSVELDEGGTTGTQTNANSYYHNHGTLPGNQVNEPDTGNTDTGVEDDDVEICYDPGVTMGSGELYLDGGFFTLWNTAPAASARSGDTEMCAVVRAVSGEEVKMNAWFMARGSAVVAWAAYNNECSSIDWQGSVTVDGAAVSVETRPWSDAAWSSDPCMTGGDGYFLIP